MKHLILESIKPFSVLFISLILCAGEALGAEEAVITIGNTSSSSYAATFTSSSTNTHVTASATSFTKGSSMSTSNSTYTSATAPYSVKFLPGSNINTDEWSDNYSVSAQFTVASEYTFSPTAISATIVTEAANYTYQAILTDGVTSYTSDDVSSSSNGVFTFNFSSLSGTALAGTITFKIRFKSTAGNKKFFVINLPITITGDVASGCSATQPGAISKGTVSGGVITLTAGGDPATGETWYWQDAADGTATTESGATKNVNTAGTYYIRSYKASETCWSAATSVTVNAEDFYTPCETPHISVDPNSAEATYNRGDAATALSVTASVSDGGTLSYQWYSNTTATNSGGTLISGATSADYTPSTAVAGTLYYYCVVTNTLAGHSAASATSNVSGAITVNSSCPGVEGGILYTLAVKNLSYSVPAATETDMVSTYATVTGGGAYIGNNSSSDGKAQVSTTGGGTVYFNGADGYLKIVLDCPIQTGDMLTFTNGEGSRQISFTTTASRATTYYTTSNSYTFPEAFNGVSTIYIWRYEGSATYLHELSITRPVSYSITYDCDGAESGCPSNVDVAYSLPDPLPDAPVKSGFDFEGWYTNAGKTDAAVAGAPLTGDITLYAKWVAARPTPTFTWTYDNTVKAGGTYPVSVATDGDADVTLSIVSAVSGVELSSTAGNPATGTVTLGSYPAAATFTYRATSPETAAYREKTEVKTVTIERCETTSIVSYADNLIDVGGSVKPRYYCEKSGVGRIMKGTGTSSISTNSSSFPGESWATKYFSAGEHSIQAYKDDVFKIVLYVKAGSNDTHITELKYSDEYKESSGDWTDIEATSQIIYHNDPEATSLTKNVCETITIIPPSPMSKDGWLYFKLSSSTNVWGAKLYTPGGEEPTSVVFSGETVIEKYPGDAAFTKMATQTTTPIISGGGITYASSDETVATVDENTGEVTILNVGRTTITATLSAFGCFNAATASYSLVVKKCIDPICSIAITTGNANKCSSDVVTLTATAAAGATFQWYKDDAALLGETNPTLTTTSSGEFYATATKECLQKSNTIEIVDISTPTATALHSYYYIKAGRVTPPIKLFKVTNIQSWSVSPAAPAGCAYELGEDSIIYLTGTPSASLVAGNQNITVTVHNNCGFADAQATLQLRSLASTVKPTVAWIADGSKGETLPGTVAEGKSTTHALYTYLQTSFDMTAVNAYCTTDEKKISDYYSQFDVVLLTDYPATDKSPSKDKNDRPHSYSNAIGSLIDEKPILSLEAFVAGCPNWGINTTPETPADKQSEMNLMCSAHNIFRGTFPIDEKITVLSKIDGEGLQGFTGLEAPPGMIFIATIGNGDNELVNCCERQKVLEARMMIMGLNYSDMANLTGDGKLIIKQILDYLLQYEEMSDCSLVFDNGEGNTTFDPGSYSGTGTKGDGKWSTAANWAPAYNVVPKPLQTARIKKDCQVDIPNAHCSTVHLMKGNDGTGDNDAHLTILPEGGLTLTDNITIVQGRNFLTTYPISAGDLVIQSSAAGNGALVFGNAEEDLVATVQYYSKATGAGISPVWQYMGIPIADKPMAIDTYYLAWMCSWENVGNVTSNWTWVQNEDRISPFKGYCITQAAAKTYVHVGTLNAPEEKNLSLRYFTSVDGDGFNMFANSWVAPIDITKMEVADFGAAAEPTIFIYNAGTRADYAGGGDPSTVGTNTSPGQYNAIPVAAASYLSGSLTKIPSMQGFFVQATKNGTLTLNYDKICFDKENYETSTDPTRAPKRMAESEDIVPEVMRLDVNGAHWSDRLYILTHPEFSGAFNLGWDGTKQEGDAQAPMLALPDDAGLLAVAAIESAEERELLFRAGEDSAYTFRFDYSGETIYLYDRLTEQATEIRTGNTYSFVARNSTAMPRFLITKNPPRTPTAVENTTYSVQNTEARKMIIDGVLYILRDNRFYDARGVQVADQRGKEGAQ